MKILVGLLLISAVALSGAANAQLGGAIKKGLGLGQQTGLSEAKIGSGLKEALKVGTENTVELTGRKDGYLRNEAIKILMPGELKTLEKGLRLVGYGSQIDEFTLSMNRAAEEAAPFAKEIFLNAIGEMTFDDARKILSGGDTAATDYFERKTSDDLTAAFSPVVEKTMDQYGVNKQYDALVGKYKDIPFAGKIGAFDVDQYVVTKAIAGLFYVLGQEEEKIRTQPAARVTGLLKEVFR